MHCSNYGKVGHNKPRCPEPLKAAPPNTNKRARKKNLTEEEQEMERAEMEVQTGEAQLMEEALMDESTQNTQATCVSAVFVSVLELVQFLLL